MRPLSWQTHMIRFSQWGDSSQNRGKPSPALASQTLQCASKTKVPWGSRKTGFPEETELQLGNGEVTLSRRPKMTPPTFFSSQGHERDSPTPTSSLLLLCVSPLWCNGPFYEAASSGTACKSSRKLPVLAPQLCAKGSKCVAFQRCPPMLSRKWGRYRQVLTSLPTLPGASRQGIA